MRAICAALFYLSDKEVEQIGNDMDRPFEAVLALWIVVTTMVVLVTIVTTRTSTRAFDLWM
jgi:hypothetical protein